MHHGYGVPSTIPALARLATSLSSRFDLESPSEWIRWNQQGRLLALVSGLHMQAHSCMHSHVNPHLHACINACSPHAYRLEEKETRLYIIEQRTVHRRKILQFPWVVCVHTTATQLSLATWYLKYQRLPVRNVNSFLPRKHWVTLTTRTAN